LGLFRQMIGRGLRPAEGKNDCVILDHSGAVFQHGLPEDPITWALHQDRKAANKKHELRNGTPASRLTTCPRCSAIRNAGAACRMCGWEPQRRPQDVEVLDGDLGRVDRQRHAQTGLPTEADKRFWHGALWFIANERARARAFNARGWVYHKYLERFGHKPPWGNPAPVPPNAEVRSWVRSRDIAYAKSQAKQRGTA
jgi:DNA repair protein RadD